jgi:2-polyprenyl-3-methyl-5-hydroxy-6-metoxy-1,4-benzoquinol methylase
MIPVAVDKKAFELCGTPAVSPEVERLYGQLQQVCALDDEQLDQLHYDWEAAFADLIRNSRKSSGERRAVVAAAYDGLIVILKEKRRRQGKVLDCMGFCPGQVEEICTVAGPPPRSVLDVGCSTGVLVASLLQRGYAAKGIDVSGDCIAEARNRLEALGADAEGKLLSGDFLAHDFGEARFDLIYSNDVLEHIPPDEVLDFLKKAHSLLNPSGLLWLITPNRWTGPGDATILRHPWGTEARGLHLKEHTLRELNQALQRCGFVEVHSRLWSDGRWRKGTRPRRVYNGLKVLLEPALARLSAGVRRRIMIIMRYAEVLAVRNS